MTKLFVDPEFAKSLHFQCASENLEKVEVLLEAGADPNETYEITAEVADTALKNRFNDLDVRLFADKKAPIHLAMETKNLKLIKLLKRYGANLYLESYVDSGSRPSTPIEMAISSGFIEAVRYVHEELKESFTPYSTPSFRMAVFAIGTDGTLETFRYVLKSMDLTIEGLSSERKANLMRAAEKPDVPILFAEYLLANGIDVNEEAPIEEDSLDSWRNGGRWTENRRDYLEALYDTLPIIRAAYHGNVDHVNLYLQHGADPAKRDRFKNTAFDAASDTRGALLTPRHFAITNIMKEALQEKGTIVPFPRAKPPLPDSGNALPNP